MRLLPVLTALLLASVTAAPAFAAKFDSRYVPSDDVLAEVETAATWVEMYPLSNKGQVAKALKRAERGEAPVSDVVAVMSMDTLRYATKGREQALPVIRYEVLRGATVVDYADKCSTAPQLGDTLTATFMARPDGVEVTLSANLVKYYAFAEESDTPLNLDNASACSDMRQFRGFFQGTLTLKNQGKVQDTRKVLVQHIAFSTIDE